MRVRLSGDNLTMSIQKKAYFLKNLIKVKYNKGRRLKFCGTMHCRDIQSNLSKPYPDKTEHLPKPNDFRGSEFFPYYSLLKKPE